MAFFDKIIRERLPEWEFSDKIITETFPDAIAVVSLKNN
jgi:hypothetical protein